MELTLYTAPMSRGEMVEWLLKELEVPFSTQILDWGSGEHKTEAYRAIHPLGSIPALVVDGRPMMESLAMCIFLGDTFPEKGLAPAPDSPWRAAYLQWLVYGTATLEPVLSPPFIRSLSVPPAERQTVATDDEREAMQRVLEPLPLHDGRPYLLGESFSAADVVVGCELIWARQVGLLQNAPREVQSYTDRLVLRFRESRTL